MLTGKKFTLFADHLLLFSPMFKTLFYIFIYFIFHVRNKDFKFEFK